MLGIDYAKCTDWAIAALWVTSRLWKLVRGLQDKHAGRTASRLCYVSVEVFQDGRGGWCVDAESGSATMCVQ